MTNIQLYNIIRNSCTSEIAEDIIQYCNNNMYNKARIIIDDLKEKKINDLHKLVNIQEEDKESFNIILNKFKGFQIIWDEVVHRLEEQENYE